MLKVKLFFTAFAGVAFGWPEFLPTLPPGVPDFTLPITLPSTFPDPDSLTLPNLSTPPYKLHFHETDRNFGLPMGVVYDERHEMFHMYYASPQKEGESGAKVERRFRGSVGHAISPDLVNWESEDQVIQPSAKGCYIDGGSVIIHEKEFIMYYGERCCKDVDHPYDLTVCPTSIHRATSTDGYHWLKRHAPIMTDEFYHYSLPSVVYDSIAKRFVMVRYGEMNAKEIGDDVALLYQPSFFHSIDGEQWTYGGKLRPPNNIAGEPLYFRFFRPNFLVPFGGSKWLLMGERTDRRPVFLTGTLDSRSVFVADQDFDNTLGGNFMFDWVDTPFPVWNHPNATYVMMGLVREAGRWDEEKKDAYMPLTFPVSYTPGAAATEMKADWLPAVRALIPASTAGAAISVAEGTSRQMTATTLSSDGLYAWTVEVDTSGIRTFHFTFECEQDSKRVYGVTFKYSNDPSGVEVIHLGIKADGTDALPWGTELPKLETAPQSHTMTLLLDNGMAEVKVGDWISRDALRAVNGVSTGTCTLKNNDGIYSLHVKAGWTFAAMTTPAWKVTSPPTDTPPSPSGAFSVSAGLNLATIVLLPLTYLLV